LILRDQSFEFALHRKVALDGAQVGDLVEELGRIVGLERVLVFEFGEHDPGELLAGEIREAAGLRGRGRKILVLVCQAVECEGHGGVLSKRVQDRLG